MQLDSQQSLNTDGMASASTGNAQDTNKVDKDIEVVRKRCLTRGLSSMKCFGQAFRMFDKDYSRSISFNEFKTGLEKYGLDMEEEKKEELFNKFDKDG